MQAPSLSALLLSGAVALPFAWLVASRIYDAGSAWGVKLLLTSLLTVSILLLGKLAWRLISTYRSKRKTKRELLEKKARLWNKLSSIGTPINNCKTICIEEYDVLKQKMLSGQLAPVDVLEAFQARTLLLDQKAKASKIKEVVYDADVKALLLEGRAKDFLMPAAAFYYNGALVAFEDRDEDGDVCQKDHPVVLALRAEGAIDIALVDKDITQVSGLLLNHGAFFFVGQYPIARLGEVLRSIASKPVCATLLQRDQPAGRFLAILASQARLPSLAASAVTPGMRDHLLTPPSSPTSSTPAPPRLRVGFLFVHQRRSQADGRKPPGDDSVVSLLSTVSDQVALIRDIDFGNLLSASQSGNKAKIRSAVEAVLAQHSLDGVAVVAGVDSRLAEQLASFMDMSVFHLTDHLAELYLCHPHDRLRAGLAIAQAFGSAIRL